MTSSRDWLITHDFAHHFGGAERCTALLANAVLPQANLHVLAADESTIGLMGVRPERVSQVVPGGANRAAVHRGLSVFAGLALRGASPFPGNVVSSTYAFAHWRRAEGRKIIYCHSPLRQIYSSVDATKLGRIPLGLRRRMLGPVWSRDRAAAQEADLIVGTSSVVNERILRYWGREPDALIPPPVDLAAFFPNGQPSRDYLLFVGRIVEPYKRLSLLIEAVRGMPEQLIVVGEGRDREELMAKSPSNVRFVGNMYGEALRDLYANASLTVFPSTDDFGMVPIESLACGTPVVAFGEGGALDSIREEENGIFFQDLNPEGLRRALRSGLSREWSYDAVNSSAERFSKTNFVERFSKLVADA